MEEKKEEGEEALGEPPVPPGVRKETEESGEEVPAEVEQAVEKEEETEAKEQEEQKPEEEEIQAESTEETREEEAKEEPIRELEEAPLGTLEVEAPTTPEEQEKKIVEDIKEAGDAIREDIGQAPEEQITDTMKSAIGLEEEFTDITAEDKGKIAEAMEKETDELKEDIREKKEVFKRRYIDKIKGEIGQVRKEIADEIAEPKPEEIEHIKGEIRKIDKEVKEIPASEKIVEDNASKLFEELKKKGTLRGVKVRTMTKVPEQRQRPTPREIIRRSLEQTGPKEVPSAWELLQRKKAKESKEK